MAAQVTKAMRYQIIKPVDITWEQLGKILRDMSYQTTKLCNMAIQKYWEHHQYRLAVKAETGAYPTSAEEKQKYGCSFQNYVYRLMREMYPLIASSNISQTNQFAKKRWQSDVKDIMNLKKSVPSFRLGTPIQVASQNYRLYVSDDNEFLAEITLLSREADQGRVTVLLDGGDKTKKIIYRRVVEGTYKKGAMQIVRNDKKKKWFCIITYTFTPEKCPGIDPDRVMGVNFACGDSLAYWAFSHSPKRGGIPAGEAEAAERKIAAITARRIEMQRTAGSRGHGRKRRLIHTRLMQGKAFDIRNTLNHKYSRRIVEIASANKCGKIRLADMSAVKTEGLLKNWPWADLVAKVSYKAREKGIEVETVSRDTAKITCSKCGYEAAENTEGNSEYLLCKNPDCGARVNMRYNTARNLACC